MNKRIWRDSKSHDFIIAKIVLDYLASKNFGKTCKCFFDEYAFEKNIEAMQAVFNVPEIVQLPSLEDVLEDYFLFEEDDEVKSDALYRLWKSLDVIIKQLRGITLGKKKNASFIKSKYKSGNTNQKSNFKNNIRNPNFSNTKCLSSSSTMPVNFPSNLLNQNILSSFPSQNFQNRNISQTDTLAGLTGTLNDKKNDQIASSNYPLDDNKERLLHESELPENSNNLFNNFTSVNDNQLSKNYDKTIITSTDSLNFNSTPMKILMDEDSKQHKSPKRKPHLPRRKRSSLEKSSDEINVSYQTQEYRQLIPSHGRSVSPQFQEGFNLFVKEFCDQNLHVKLAENINSIANKSGVVQDLQGLPDNNKIIDDVLKAAAENPSFDPFINLFEDLNLFIETQSNISVPLSHTEESRHLSDDNNISQLEVEKNISSHNPDNVFPPVEKNTENKDVAIQQNSSTEYKSESNTTMISERFEHEQNQLTKHEIHTDRDMQENIGGIAECQTEIPTNTKLTVPEDICTTSTKISTKTPTKEANNGTLTYSEKLNECEHLPEKTVDKTVVKTVGEKNITDKSPNILDSNQRCFETNISTLTPEIIPVVTPKKSDFDELHVKNLFKDSPDQLKQNKNKNEDIPTDENLVTPFVTPIKQNASEKKAIHFILRKDDDETNCDVENQKKIDMDLINSYVEKVQSLSGQKVELNHAKLGEELSQSDLETNLDGFLEKSAVNENELLAINTLLLLSKSPGKSEQNKSKIDLIRINKNEVSLSGMDETSSEWKSKLLNSNKDLLVSSANVDHHEDLEAHEEFSEKLLTKATTDVAKRVDKKKKKSLSVVKTRPLVFNNINDATSKANSSNSNSLCNNLLKTSDTSCLKQDHRNTPEKQIKTPKKTVRFSPKQQIVNVDESSNESFILIGKSPVSQKKKVQSPLSVLTGRRTPKKFQIVGNVISPINTSSNSYKGVRKKIFDDAEQSSSTDITTTSHCDLKERKYDASNSSESFESNYNDNVAASVEIESNDTEIFSDMSIKQTLKSEIEKSEDSKGHKKSTSKKDELLKVNFNFKKRSKISETSHRKSKSFPGCKLDRNNSLKVTRNSVNTTSYSSSNVSMKKKETDLQYIYVPNSNKNFKLNDSTSVADISSIHAKDLQNIDLLIDIVIETNVSPNISRTNFDLWKLKSKSPLTRTVRPSRIVPESSSSQNIGPVTNIIPSTSNIIKPSVSASLQKTLPDLCIQKTDISKSALNNEVNKNVTLTSDNSSSNNLSCISSVTISKAVIVSENVLKESTFENIDGYRTDNSSSKKRKLSYANIQTDEEGKEKRRRKSLNALRCMDLESFMKRMNSQK